jgi:hypothetical protein
VLLYDLVIVSFLFEPSQTVSTQLSDPGQCSRHHRNSWLWMCLAQRTKYLSALLKSIGSRFFRKMQVVSSSKPSGSTYKFTQGLTSNDYVLHSSQSMSLSKCVDSFYSRAWSYLFFTLWFNFVDNGLKNVSNSIGIVCFFFLKLADSSLAWELHSRTQHMHERIILLSSLLMKRDTPII